VGGEASATQQSSRAGLTVFLPGDSYDTPADRRRLLGDRLALGTRWYFTYLFARLVVTSAQRARRGQYDDEAWIRSSYRSLRDLEGCGARFHIRGMEHVRRAKPPAVFIANHMSILETFVLPCLVCPFMPVTFVVKDSLVKHPFFGPVMRSRDPVVVRRRNPREDLEAVLKGGAERLNRGVSMIVFPQATRSEAFSREDFNTLGVKLARRVGAPIVPVALKTDFWANGRWLKDFGPLHRGRPVQMVFGEAMPVSGNGAQQHEAIVRFIEAQMTRWREDTRDAVSQRRDA
jgi:1-acyl-sn-glycerol-3-phosphate acyltransferase